MSFAFFGVVGRKTALAPVRLFSHRWLVTISEELKLLVSGTENVVTEVELARKLAVARTEKRPLLAKLGCDPTAPDLHLGHGVVLQKLRQFQDLGHKAILIIGDYTALIGDPSGRSITRPQLSIEQVLQNATTYKQQAFKILDEQRTELVFNSQWFGKMTATDLIRLSGHATAAQMLQRRDFKERFQKEIDITLSEFLYPLLQGWDSVMVHSDVELGGTDQLFNMLVGRDLQQDEAQPQQVVLAMPLLEGTDGVNKMSKSLGNTIGLADLPGEMYGKVMSIRDELMWRWWRLLFAKTDVEIATLQQGHPMAAKKQLAFALVERFHSRRDAEEAAQHFEKQFSKKELGEVAQPLEVSQKNIGVIELVELAQAPTAKLSRSEIRRLIQQGGIELDGQKLVDPNARLTLHDGQILHVGKRIIVKISMVR